MIDLIGHGIALVSCIGIFLLLQHSYRSGNATEESFLCALLVAIASCWIPDMAVMLPIVWWGFHLVWADNFKVWLASILGVILVGVYVGAGMWILPNHPWMVAVRENWQQAFVRHFIYPSSGVEMVVLGSLLLTSLFFFIAHLSRFTRTSGKMQANLLLCAPVLLLALVSSLFPGANGASLAVVVLVVDLYLVVLYLKVWGLPKRKPRRHRKVRSTRTNRRALRYAH